MRLGWQARGVRHHEIVPILALPANSKTRPFLSAQGCPSAPERNGLPIIPLLIMFATPLAVGLVPESWSLIVAAIGFTGALIAAALSGLDLRPAIGVDRRLHCACARCLIDAGGTRLEAREQAALLAAAGRRLRVRLGPTMMAPALCAIGELHVRDDDYSPTSWARKVLMLLEGTGAVRPDPVIRNATEQVTLGVLAQWAGVEAIGLVPASELARVTYAELRHMMSAPEALVLTEAIIS